VWKGAKGVQNFIPRWVRENTGSLQPYNRELFKVKKKKKKGRREKKKNQKESEKKK